MQAKEALAATLSTVHNLAYYLGIMERVRQSLAG
jgi:queuine/archaeosine tRNA-ribosyltransferase